MWLAASYTDAEMLRACAFAALRTSDPFVTSFLNPSEFPPCSPSFIAPLKFLIRSSKAFAKVSQLAGPKNSNAIQEQQQLSDTKFSPNIVSLCRNFTSFRKLGVT